MLADIVALVAAVAARTERQMAKLELAELIRPISDAEPCGLDLDSTGDAEFMNFMATAEGLMPTSFLVEEEDSTGKMTQRPFWERGDGRAKTDFAVQIAVAEPLIHKTRDLRLLATLAKFSILNKDLSRFTTFIEAMATLLGQYWDGVHPRGDADFSMRLAVLATLDDPDPVILPLRYCPLLEHKNFGTISYRSYVAATGQPAPGADTVVSAPIEKALKVDADLGELIRTRDLLERLNSALTRIREVCAERLGIGIFKLEALPRLVDQMRSLLESVIVFRDPAAATLSRQAAPSQPEGVVAEAGDGPALPLTLTKKEDAANALAAVIAYFSRVEPSNPALLLARQARALIGKSFVESMQLLIPTQVQNASLRIGSDIMLDLPLERLAAPQPGSAAQENPTAAEPMLANGPQTGTGGAQQVANTRQEAIALLEQVGRYFRAVEPSSPIPLLTDRARGLTGRDFMSLLGDVLSKAK
jgi:type VI secretion system protein ImpA